jgi:Uma2 family endonuclease
VQAQADGIICLEDGTVTNTKITDLDQLLREGAIRLEITGGIPTWEAFPGSRHQRMIDRIRASIEPTAENTLGCACAHLSDVLIRFQDGSLKRPDIAIFCAEPPEQDEALTVIPQAVIEIISPGYEYKDLALNPQFYLAQSVQDVVIVDPRSRAVTHYQTSQVANHRAPVNIELQCGCSCKIP